MLFPLFKFQYFSFYSTSLSSEFVECCFGIGNGITEPTWNWFRVITSVVTNQTKQRNIITDPQSCSERWGDHCVAPVVVVPAVLDLGDTTIQEHLTPHNHLAPHTEGESIKVEAISIDELDLSIGATNE